MVEKDDLANMPTLRLSNTVTRRTVPMTARGCDMLRAIREYQQDKLLSETGVKYDIPFPTSIHMMFTDYCELRNIKVEHGEDTNS